MDNFFESVSKRDFDRRIPEVIEMLEEKQLYGTISLIKDLKYHLDLAVKEKTSCNCKHNSNSRDNEPCCRCDSRQTNADRIRNMSDKELVANMMCPNENGLAEIDCDKNDNCNCCECLLKWLQSEAE